MFCPSGACPPVASMRPIQRRDSGRPRSPRFSPCSPRQRNGNRQLDNPAFMAAPQDGSRSPSRQCAGMNCAMSKTTRATAALVKLGVAFATHTYDYDPDASRIGLQAAEALGVAPHRVLKTLMA